MAKRDKRRQSRGIERLIELRVDGRGGKLFGFFAALGSFQKRSVTGSLGQLLQCVPGKSFRTAIEKLPVDLLHGGAPLLVAVRDQTAIHFTRKCRGRAAEELGRGQHELPRGTWLESQGFGSSEPGEGGGHNRGLMGRQF